MSTSEFYHNGSVYMKQWLKYTLQFLKGITELTMIFKCFHEEYPLHNMASLGWNYLVLVKWQVREIYCSETSKDYCLPIA